MLSKNGTKMHFLTQRNHWLWTRIGIFPSSRCVVHLGRYIVICSYLVCFMFKGTLINLLCFEGSLWYSFAKCKNGFPFFLKMRPKGISLDGTVSLLPIWCGLSNHHGFLLISGSYLFVTLCSYLICSMFEEAASLASSILKLLCSSHDIVNEAGDDNELYDMLESSGMVFVQAMKELGRWIDS